MSVRGAAVFSAFETNPLVAEHVDLPQPLFGFPPRRAALEQRRRSSATRVLPQIAPKAFAANSFVSSGNNENLHSVLNI